MLQICFCVYLVCPLERRNALAEALGGEDDLESKTVTSLKPEFLASVFTRADDVNNTRKQWRNTVFSESPYGFHLQQPAWVKEAFRRVRPARRPRPVGYIKSMVTCSLSGFAPQRGYLAIIRSNLLYRFEDACDCVRRFWGAMLTILRGKWWAGAPTSDQ